MRAYQLEVELITGEFIRGKASTIRIENKEEYLILDVLDSSNGQQKALRLDTIKSLTPMKADAEFNTVFIN